MVAASTVRSSWRNVANGARLVASAVVHQTAEEAAVVAQRVTRHGVDAMVSSKAAARQQTTGSSLLEAAAAAAAQSILLTPTALRTTFGSATGYWRNDNNNNNNSTPYQKETTTTTILPGSSNPYESQWRRKQVESHQEPLKVPLSFSSEGNTELSSPSSSSSSSSANTTTTILPNPYLLHAPPGLSDDSSSATRPSSSSLSSATITNSDSDSDLDLDLESHPHPHSLLERTIRPTTDTTLPSPASSQNKDKGPIPAPPTSAPAPVPPAPPVSTDPTRPLLKEGRAVPSSRVGRAAGFASLGAGLAWGTASAWAGNLFSGGGAMTNHNNNNNSTGGGGAVTSDANADRLAATLCRMRGAALKMGQMLSIQDESLLPPALTRALTQVRQGAEAMPQYQLQKQLESQLGVDWRSRFDSFEDLPFAAASIGQVHRATIRSNSDEDGTGTGTGGGTGDGQIRQVVVKVQYPGVARSIESDLQNLTMLVKMTGLAPKGLFLDNVIRVGRDELKVECNYLNESANQQAFQDLVFHDPILRENNVVVPDVVEELTTEQVLVSAYAPGGTIDQVQHLDQEERNRIGRTIMYLTMKELFVWRLMQTDPNWGNFLYDVGSQQTTLIDFGAAREYPQDFVDGYLRIVWANANRDEATLMDQSRRLGFLTGEENELMLRAHTLSGFTLGEPFATDEPFDFRGSKISSRMSEHTSVFMKHRLTPPPEEVYTLHRKLAGAYMLCIKVGAVVSCRDMLEDIVRSHHFQDGLPPPIMSSSSSTGSSSSSSSS